MAFLSSFANDIFISYAHLNDETPPGRDQGWVTTFRQKLDFELEQRFARKGDVKIWRDKEEMGGSTRFNDAIKDSINRSGIFIAINSRGYLSEESYCPKELSCFHDKALKEPYGINIGTRSRIVNVLLQQIPPEEWLPQMEGMAGHLFHDEERGRRAELGEQFYETQMIKLVNELEKTLRMFKTLTDVPPREAGALPNGFKVFLAYAEGALRTKRDRVAEELGRKGVEVISDIPPPYGAVAHEEEVTNKLKDVSLSVHLLDEDAGNKIDGDITNTYYQKQVELGLQHAKRQLICVPKALEIEEITNPSHKTLVDNLENRPRGEASYRFIRETPPNLIAAEIQQEIEKILSTPPPGAAAGRAALLDIHEKDMEENFAGELSPVLMKRKITLLINAAGDGPDDSMTIFDEVRKQISVLIIVLGHVTDLWASRRLNFSLQVGISSLKFCGIYAPPVGDTATPRAIDLSVFQIPPVKIPVAFFYNPQMLAGLLDQYVSVKE